TLMHLDEEMHWFSPVPLGEAPTSQLTVQMIAEFVAQYPEGIKTGDIIGQFIGQHGKSTIERRIDSAKKAGLIYHYGRGVYKAVNPSSPIPFQPASEAELSSNEILRTNKVDNEVVRLALAA